MKSFGEFLLGLIVFVNVLTGLICGGLFIYGVFTIVFTSVGLGGYYVGMSILIGIAAQIGALFLAMIAKLIIAGCE